MTNAITTVQEKPFSLAPQSFEQAVEFSKMVARSNLAPKDFRGKPEDCLIAMQWGAEIGLQPLQALQNIAVINGRPALWGDTVIALVRASPLCEWGKETDDGTTATCTVKRRGEDEQARSFSMDDAKHAGLAGKQGPWSQYPKRMRQMRARAFALRDVFPDVLRGLPMAEEVMDIPTEKHMGPAEVVKPTEPEVWTAEAWEKTLPKILAGIKKGRTIEQALAWLNGKAKVTPEQEADLRKQVAPAPAEAAPAPAPETPEATFTYAEVADRLNNAKDMEELAEAGSVISGVQQDQRAELVAIYEKRATELEGVAA